MKTIGDYCTQVKSRWEAPIAKKYKALLKTTNWLLVIFGILEPAVSELIEIFTSIQMELPTWFSEVRKYILIGAFFLRVFTKMTIEKSEESPTQYGEPVKDV